MHIVIGFLTTVVTLLWLMHRLAEMGIDLGGLNPFYWRRRKAWRKKYEGDPIHAVEDPLGVAALLVIGVAKIDGDITAEEKQSAIDLFSDKFSLDPKAATQLFTSSSHLLGNPQVIRHQLDGVVERHTRLFESDQVESLLEMLQTIAMVENSPQPDQVELIEAIRNGLATAPPKTGAWA